MDKREPTIRRCYSSVTTSFGHLSRAEPSSVYARALQSLACGPLKDWKRPPVRPRTTWLWTVESDLQPANIGLFSVHCLLTSPRPLYVEAIHAKSHTAGQGIHRMMMHNNSVI